MHQIKTIIDINRNGRCDIDGARKNELGWHRKISGTKSGRSSMILLSRKDSERNDLVEKSLIQRRVMEVELDR